MLTLCAIASGSNGNCYYIGNSREAILIDAGISARQTIMRMQKRDIDPDSIIAIFISHEHNDHICGARVLSKKLNIPVYITSRTFTAAYPNHKPAAPRFFIPNNEIKIGSFHVIPFSKNHDAAEPCSFRIENNGMQVGVFTDIGSACENVISNLKQCDALFLESNYDEKMLWEGRYPWPLKKRIASDHGHLSNDQAFELIMKHSDGKLKKIFLSHLSAENNTKEKAIARFQKLDNIVDIHMTSRHSAGEVIKISHNEQPRMNYRQGILNFE
jgi:phosphoribosyl 1,2-cyclic phosphodiesterase